MNNLTLLFCLYVFALTSAPLAVVAQPTETPVIVTKVLSVPFEDKIEALGTLRANESVVLTASVTETVTAVDFEDGQRVSIGQTLVEMTSEEEHAQLEEARSRLDEAERQYKRIAPLARSGAAPASLGDERKREVETARAQLRAIESRLADRLIKAPFSGVVGLRNISVGLLVNPGDPVVTLDDDSVMKLDFPVPSTLLAELAPGMSIVARARAFGSRRFEGTVAAIDSRIDPVTRSIVVRALLPNEDRLLRPGLLMSVELLHNRRETLVVPEEALVKEGEENFVFTVKSQDGVMRAEKSAVSIGSRRPGEIEITEGLAAGDLVVTHGTLTVRAGAQVEIVSRQQGDEPLTQMLSAATADAKK